MFLQVLSRIVGVSRRAGRDAADF